MITFKENVVYTDLSMSENMQACTSCGELVPIEYVMCVWCGFDLTAEHIRRAGITIGKREAIGRLQTLVRDPMRMAKEISLIPDLTGGKLVFYFLGFMMTLNMLAVFGKLAEADFNQVESGISVSLRVISFTITFKFIVGLAFLLVQPLVLYLIFFFFWKFATNVVILLIKSIGGYADKMKVRTAIGYSMLPVLLGWTLSFLFTLISPKVSLGGGITYNSVNQAVIEVTRSGVGFVGFLFINIGWIWSIILMVITIRQAAKLSVIEGIIVAGLPSTLMMIIVLYGTEFLT